MRLIDADELQYRLSVTDDDEQIVYLRGEDVATAPTIDAVPVAQVTAAVDAALSVINEFAAEMDYCVYSRIYQAVAAIGGNDEHE